MQKRFGEFANEKFGCKPTGIDEYRLFTRSNRYKGTIMLSGKDKGIKKTFEISTISQKPFIQQARHRRELKA